ncbi:MAG: hypothetical protein U9O98_08395 [Asgard group archaeon]|nr:hypothetical protein [Asgard group archaeon]
MPENSQPIIDGQSKYVLTHTKKSKIKESLIFIFWFFVGAAAIVLGALLSSQSWFLRIIIMLLGVSFIFIFGESFFSKISNKIILTKDSIKTRNYIFWEEILWKNVSSIQVEKSKRSLFGADESKRPTILEITTEENDAIIYPLYKFPTEEAESIVNIITTYLEENQNVVLKESANDNQLTNIKQYTEEEIIEQIPPRVTEEELEETVTEDK